MKRLLLVLLVLTVFLPGMARAQQPQGQPAEVASGADLVAWQQLEHLRLEGREAIDAYRTFALSWSASPLAAAAWGRLVELGAATVDDRDPGVSRRLAAVASRWEVLQVALADASSGDGVQDIDLSEPDPYGDDGDAAVLRDTGN